MTSANTRTNHDAIAEFNALIDAAIDGIIIIDHEGNIELFNAAAEKMFGYESVQVIGRNIKMLMPAPYQREHDNYLQHYLDTGEKRIIGKGREVKALKSNGRVFPIELSVGEVKHSSHRQFVGIIRDISDKAQFRAEAVSSRERLAQVSRLTTMGEFVAGIAHEVNQPLTAISSYSQACRNIILRAVEGDISPTLRTELATLLEKVTAQTLRASQVVSRLREFLAKRKKVRQSVQLNQLIEETIELAKLDTHILDHGIDLHLVTEPAPQLNIDPFQVQQVLLNLIQNAIDAMENQQNAPLLITSKWLTKDVIQVAVIDKGSGVPDKNKDALFQPFFSTKEANMGMGLAVSESIILAHGGRIKHCHGIPSGSIFAFELPAHSSSAYIE